MPSFFQQNIKESSKDKEREKILSQAIILQKQGLQLLKQMQAHFSAKLNQEEISKQVQFFIKFLRDVDGILNELSDINALIHMFGAKYPHLIVYFANMNRNAIIAMQESSDFTYTYLTNFRKQLEDDQLQAIADAKDCLLTIILHLPDKKREEAVINCLDKNHWLGYIFWWQRGLLKPDIAYGTLEILNTEKLKLERRNIQQLKTNEPVLSSKSRFFDNAPIEHNNIDLATTSSYMPDI